MEFIIKSPKYGEKTVLIDDEDWPLIKDRVWCLSYSKTADALYVVSNNPGYNNGQTQLHRLVTNCPKGFRPDHINHNTLDNRKHNLRVCSTSQNAQNTLKRQKNKSSKYKGISLVKRTGKYRGYIMLNYKETHLGTFTNEIEAARAYNKKALELFGEFALLNIIEEVV